MPVRIPHANTWYGFHTLAGHWGGLNYAGWVDTSFGRVETPDDGGVKDYPGYLVGAVYRGRLLMGGQSARGKGTIFWTDGGWYQLSPQCFGVSPCAFSQDGRFFYSVTDAGHGLYRDNETGLITQFATPFYTDGIRAVIPPGNEIVLGNTTNYSTRYDLHQFIDFENGLAVGQGADGLVVWHAGVRYLVEPGDAKFIRAMFDGHTLALATVKEPSRELVTWGLTVDELGQFPVAGGVDPITAINKPMHLGCFTGAPGAVGGWDTNDDPAGPPPPGNGCLDVPTFKYQLTDGLVLGSYITGGTVEDIEQRAAACPDIPICYWDGRRWPRLPNLPAGAWLCVQAYRNASESLGAFEADLRAILQQHISERPLLKHAIVPQCYTSNASMTSDLKTLVPVVSRLAASLGIHAILPFSGSGRKTGLQDHPEAYPLWDELFKTITGLPDDGGHGGSMLDWGTIHTYGRQRWAEMEIERKSREAFERGDNPRPIQQRAFVEITSELYHDKGIPVNLFWKAGVPDYNNPADVEAKLHHIGEDTAVDLAADQYKDIVNSMGCPIPTSPNCVAVWDASPGHPGHPITPGDQSRCGPPPKLKNDPEPSEVEVLIYRYDHETHRSDPHGMEVVFEIESARPVVEVQAFLEDGSPPLTASFPAVAGTPDGRYYRGIRFKATINGSWALVVRAKNDQGVWGEARGATPVTVSP